MTEHHSNSFSVKSTHGTEALRLMLPKTWKSLYISAPGLIVTGLMAWIYFSEWYRVGIEAHPGTLNGYYFGSEAMIGHGGWIYESATLYAKASLIQGLVTGVISLVFLVALWRKYISVGWLGHILLVLSIVAQTVIMG